MSAICDKCDIDSRSVWAFVDFKPFIKHLKKRNCSPLWRLGNTISLITLPSFLVRCTFRRYRRIFQGNWKRASGSSHPSGWRSYRYGQLYPWWRAKVGLPNTFNNKECLHVPNFIFCFNVAKLIISIVKWRRGGHPNFNHIAYLRLSVIETFT